MTNLLILFIVLNVVNVIIQTIKSIATVKCGKVIASLVNAVAYGLYTFVVIYMNADGINIWVKAGIIALANLIGVYVVKVFEEKAKRDKLWKVEMACPLAYYDEVNGLLTEKNIPHNYTFVGKWVMFNCYCMTQNDTRAVTDIGSKRECKFSAYESKALNI